MLNFLSQIFDSIVLFIKNLLEWWSFIPRLLSMFVESIDLVNSAITYSPDFLFPILTMMLAVAAVMWLVTLL